MKEHQRPYWRPATMYELQQLLVQACLDHGLQVPAEGINYSNGPEYDTEIMLPNGLVAFVKIRESQDEEYLMQRYDGDAYEPEDPPEEHSPSMTDEQAETLRRELEEEEHFKALGHDVLDRYDRDAMEPDLGPDDC